jgi:hypothetical protein
LSKLIPKHLIEKFSWILHNSFTNSRITCIPCGIATCMESLWQFDKIVHNFPFWLCRHPSLQSVSWRELSSICLCQLGLLTDLWKIDHSQDFYHEETPLLNFCNPIAFILMRTIWGLHFQKLHDRSVIIRAWLLELILSRTFVGHDDILPTLYSPPWASRACFFVPCMFHVLNCVIHVLMFCAEQKCSMFNKLLLGVEPTSIGK